MASLKHRSIAFLALFALLSLASCAESDDGAAPWDMDASSRMSDSSSSSINGVTSFRKHGGFRRANSDGDNEEGDVGASKTIAQRIDEALEQEFPEEKQETIGKTYSEKAKQEDVRFFVFLLEEKKMGVEKHPTSKKKTQKLKKLNLFSSLSLHRQLPSRPPWRPS